MGIETTDGGPPAEMMCEQCATVYAIPGPPWWHRGEAKWPLPCPACLKEVLEHLDVPVLKPVERGPEGE